MATTKDSPPNKNGKSNGKPPSKSTPGGKPPAKAPPGKTTSASKNAPKTAAKPPSKGAKDSPRPSRKATAKSPAVWGGMSNERKLDIVGVVLAFAGFLTFLSLLSPRNSSFIGEWVGLLSSAFGIGMWVVPLGLAVVGVWLWFRNSERFPQFQGERVVGIFLLFVNLLAWMHLLLRAVTDLPAETLAEQGRGGGFLGAGVLEGLQAILGTGGMLVVLLAWLIIALIMTLDISVQEMLDWGRPVLQNASDGLNWLWDGLRGQARPMENNGEGWQGAPPTAISRQAGLMNSPATLANPQIMTGVHPAGSSPVSPAGAQPTWALPPLEQILEPGEALELDDDVDQARARKIEETLASFDAPARVVEINRGPTITQFGVEPGFLESRGGRIRVRVSKIASLENDLALALSARTIRIQTPVPGKGYVGIEVPNEEIALVALRDVVESEAFTRLKSPLRFALGENVAGRAVAADLAAMPHLLVAGATGSGKSVCVNALISCFLLNNTPEDLRLIMVDPKRVELTGYNGIPHLLAPVVVDVEKVVTVLQWVTKEMDRRYHKLAEDGSRNIQDYNARRVARKEEKLPYLVVIVDELADLMMLSPDETERALTRLAQLARATGIHLVIATQRPSVDVVTGLIKANFPARVAFMVTSNTDSRVILDQPGAERLLGRGDMLFQAPDAPAPVRLQGVYVSDEEIQRLVYYWRMFARPEQPAAMGMESVPDALPPGVPLKQMPMWDEMEAEEKLDPLYHEAVDLVRRQGRASISMLQTRLRIGYTRAGRLIEELEHKGVVGPPDPVSGARQVLDYGPAAPPAGEE